MKLTVATRVRDEPDLLDWYIANQTHADQIILVDGGSEKPFIDRLIDLARRDPRVIVYEWSEKPEPYTGEFEHFKFLLQKLQDHKADWYQLTDVDEIPSIKYQGEIRGFLETTSEIETSESIGAETSFLYLAPGWQTYYTECSEWPINRLFNYIPGVRSGDYVGLVVPGVRAVVPEELGILHFNWAAERRFKQKVEWYRKAHPGEIPWYPDEKYPLKADLPEWATWYSPNGDPVAPVQMPKLFKEE